MGLRKEVTRLASRVLTLDAEVYRLERELREFGAEVLQTLNSVAATLEMLADTDWAQGVRIDWLSDDLDAAENRLEALEALLEVEPELPWVDEDPEAFFQRLIDAEAVVTFDYTDAAGVETERTVSPYELISSANGGRLLRGYDHARGALRQFRLDRIEAPGPAPGVEFVDPLNA